jgi:hypothetical protein
MRYANAPVPERLAAVDRTAIGVLAFTRSARRPVACVVTPFVDGEDAVVTSVLALLRKVGSIRRNPDVAVLAGELQLRGNARARLPDGPACLLVHEERAYRSCGQMTAMAEANRALIAAWRDGCSEDAAPLATRDVRTTGI